MKLDQILEAIQTLDTDYSLALESFRRRAKQEVDGWGESAYSVVKNKSVPYANQIYCYSIGRRVPTRLLKNETAAHYPFVREFVEYSISYRQKRRELVKKFGSQVLNSTPSGGKK
jgi:hypothetical protein